MVDESDIYDDSGNIIPESEEVVMYKEQHKRTDPESKILRELEEKYNSKLLTISEMYEIFEEYKEKLGVSSQKEVHRLLIHFCGDQFSQVCTYEDLWDADYPVENDSYLMEYERKGIKTFLRKYM